MSQEDSYLEFPDLVVDQVRGVARLGSQLIRLCPYPAGSLPCVVVDGMTLVTLTVPVRSVEWINNGGRHVSEVPR